MLTVFQQNKVGAVMWQVNSAGLWVKAQGILLTRGLRSDLLQRLPGAELTELGEKTLPNRNLRYLHSPNLTVDVDMDVDNIEIRRRILALLAREAISQGSVIVHASVLSREGRAIMLLGDYGTGKTTVALKLVRSGWEQIAGDLCLVTMEGNVLAGSRAVLVRSPLDDDMRQTTLPLPPGEVRWEAKPCHGGPYTDIRIQTMAVLDVQQAKPVVRHMSQPAIAAALYAAALRVILRRRSDWGGQLLSFEVQYKLRHLIEHLGSTVQAVALEGSAAFVADHLSSNLPAMSHAHSVS